jgi:hypothetical protein
MDALQGRALIPEGIPMTPEKQEAVQTAVELYQMWQANASRHGGNIHLLMQRVWDAWQPAATPEKPRHDGEWVSVPRELLERAKAACDDILRRNEIQHWFNCDLQRAMSDELAAMLAASPAPAALGTQEGERIAELEREIEQWDRERGSLCTRLIDEKARRQKAQTELASHARTIEALLAAAALALSYWETEDSCEDVPEWVQTFRRALKEHPNGL